jgi:hypothetical protein
VNNNELTSFSPWPRFHQQESMLFDGEMEGDDAKYVGEKEAEIESDDDCFDLSD